MNNTSGLLHKLCIAATASIFMAASGHGAPSKKKIMQSFTPAPVTKAKTIAQAPAVKTPAIATDGDAALTSTLTRDAALTDSLARYETWASTASLSLPGFLTPLPEIGVAGPNTTSTFTLFPDDVTMNLDALDLETTITSDTPIPTLPQTPLPVEELEDLTSASKRARRVTLLSAVCQVLEQNQQLRVERLRPEISNTGIEEAEGEFDTVLEAGFLHRTRHTSTQGPEPREGDASEPTRSENVSRTNDFNVGLSGRLPTGTNYNLGITGSRSVTNTTKPFYNLATNLNITQNLLRGAGCEVNCVRVWTAQNNFIISLYQLQQVLIDLVTDVQSTYWNTYLAFRTLQIRLTAYAVAREQRERAEEFVRVGKSPPLEALAAQAEESSRISDIINAAADLKLRQIQLLRLINPDCKPLGWRALLYPVDKPVLPSEPLIPEQRIGLAQYYRPDLRQAQIDLSNRELEVVRTENGLLPAFDLVAELGYTGVGNSLGAAARQIRDRDFNNWALGFQFSYPLQNRQASAAHRRSNFQKNLAEEAIGNFCQIIEVDIRNAVIQIERTTRLIESTHVTRRLREEELEAEIEKFRVGRSTSLLVAQAQRDLTTAQLDEVSSEVANILAYLQLYRSEGTALQRLGIQPICVTEESGVPRD